MKPKQRVRFRVVRGARTFDAVVITAVTRVAASGGATRLGFRSAAQTR